VATYRLLVYDSPEHGFPYVISTLEHALAIPESEASELAKKAHLEGVAAISLPDAAAAEAALEKILEAGPDPRAPSSSGSLIVAIEENGAIVRRGRRTPQGFVLMDQIAIEQFRSSGPASEQARSEPTPPYRLVVYDSPAHGVPHVRRTLANVFGISEAEASELAKMIHFAGVAHFPFADLAPAEAAMDKILESGPDPDVPGSSCSVVVAVEALDGATATVVRRGRSTSQGFESVTIEEIERWIREEDSVIPPGEPMLALQAASPWWGRPWLWILVSPLIVLAPIIALESNAVPWPHGRLSGLTIIFTTLLLALTPLVFLLAWVLRRSGRVSFYENVIVLHKQEERTPAVIRIRWTQLRGFRDDSIDYVQLLRINETVADPAIAIPTPTEKDRTAVLDLLARKGLRREGS
jgi:ATP-dependent Clp protease adapter protein ClpS